MARITNCTFQNITDVRCVYVVDCNNVTVVGCVAGRGGTNLTADFVRISGNILELLVSNNSVVINEAHVVRYNSGRIVNSIISNNVVTYFAATAASPAPFRLIASADSGSQGVISGNSVVSFGTYSNVITAADFSRLSVVGNTIQVPSGSTIDVVYVSVMISASFETVPAGTVTGNSITGAPAGGVYNIIAVGDGPVAVVGNSCGDAGGTTISNITTGGITASNT